MAARAASIWAVSASARIGPLVDSVSRRCASRPSGVCVWSVGDGCFASSSASGLGGLTIYVSIECSRHETKRSTGWKKRRRAVSPAFHREWINRMVGMFGDCADRSVEELDREGWIYEQDYRKHRFCRR